MCFRSRRSRRRNSLALAGLAALSLSANTGFARPLAEILSSGALKICVQEDNQPYSSARPKPKGIFIDIGDALARNLGVEAEYTWLFSAEYIRKTDCDLVPAVASIEGDDPLKQTIPYVRVRSTLVVPKDRAPAHDLAEFKSGHVAVLATSFARHVLNEQGYSLWVRFLENDEILDAVAKGEADGGLLPLYAFQWRAHLDPALPLRTESSVALDPSFDYSAAMGLRRADAAALRKIDEALGKMIEDGELQAIFSRYGLTYEKPT